MNAPVGSTDVFFYKLVVSRVVSMRRGALIVLAAAGSTLVWSVTTSRSMLTVFILDMVIAGRFRLVVFTGSYDFLLAIGLATSFFGTDCLRISRAVGSLLSSALGPADFDFSVVRVAGLV